MEEEAVCWFCVVDLSSSSSLEEKWQRYMLQTHPNQFLTRLPPAYFFLMNVQSGKKGNTFLAHFTCLTFCFGSYNSTCKSPTILYKALVGYPSLGRHQTLEVATEYLFGAQVGIEYCTMLI